MRASCVRRRLVAAHRAVGEVEAVALGGLQGQVVVEQQEGVGEHDARHARRRGRRYGGQGDRGRDTGDDGASPQAVLLEWLHELDSLRLSRAHAPLGWPPSKMREGALANTTARAPAVFAGSK